MIEHTPSREDVLAGQPIIHFVGSILLPDAETGPAQADRCRDFFRRAVALELSFFEAAYATGPDIDVFGHVKAPSQ